MELTASSGREVAPGRLPLRRNRSEHTFRLQPPDGVKVRAKRVRWPTRTSGAGGVHVTVGSRTAIRRLTDRVSRLDGIVGRSPRERAMMR